MKTLLLGSAFIFLQVGIASACDGNCSFLQPPKDLGDIAGSNSRQPKGHEKIQENCVGPHCGREARPSAFSLISADSEPNRSKKLKKNNQ